jgi:aldose 1-epimerase
MIGYRWVVMMTALNVIENKHWQIGILPETGASIAFGRVRYNGIWLDVLRPTNPADYGNVSKCASFIMLPWANRIRAGKFAYAGQDYQLEATPPDNTARHGDVRNRIWEVEETHPKAVRLAFESSAHHKVNFPFAFSAMVEYAVEKRDFIIRLTLHNDDERPMPAGFGHHPYFVRTEDDNTPQLQVPCDQYFELPSDYMPTSAPMPIASQVDFRVLRALDDTILNDLLTNRMADDPVRIVYPAWNLEVEMHADPLFQHILVYTPIGEPSFAVEPQTIANDGFNLMARGIAGHGAFILPPGESRTATVRFHLKSSHADSNGSDD